MRIIKCQICGCDVETNIHNRKYCDNCRKNKDIEYNKEYHKVYNKTNKDIIKIGRKEYYKTNEDKKKAYQAKYSIDNRDKILARYKASYKADKDKFLAYCKKYALANKELIAAKRKKYSKNKCDKLLDTYIVARLGIPKSQCPKLLIELKRTQIEIFRALKS